MEATLVALIMKIPPQAKNYLEESYDRNKKVIKWGLKQGTLKKAFKNEITKLNGMPTLESDLEAGDGRRMVNYGFYFPEHPDKVVQVTMLFDTGKFTKYKYEFDHFINSLKIKFKNNNITK